VCKPDGHKTLYEYLKGVELEEFRTTVRKPGKHTLTYRYRWINGVPLRDGKDALDVNCLAISLIHDDGKTTYKGAFATSLKINPRQRGAGRCLRTGALEDRERNLQRA
jgi:hypothetical protein